ncbi:hypothetical protein [Tunicatimonas pelagia]|uniref:hypothetical protein n=1 Tax=Tunicatimonas pelagia TaxID=931531 RepID=UPI002667010D|nr:hypothetical protein [Tunicatimonas pelagia]WKN46531.1 hypothetical protein P0M28_30955 [Tunicatimonas pelagia]
MAKSKKLVDVLGVMTDGIPLKNDSHYQIEGWERIMTGEEFRRSKELQRVAITRAEITFENEDDLLKFLEVLKDSDDRLSRVPDSLVMYDWQSPIRNNLTVRFGVAWYDKDFYKEKKDAYLSQLHSNIFKKFGVKVDDMRVEQIPL